MTGVYFEGEPKNNKQANFTAEDIPELHSERNRMTPGYIDLTNDMQFIEGVKMRSNGEKELKIKDRVTQQVHLGDLMYRISFWNGVQYSQLRSETDLS